MPLRVVTAQPLLGAQIAPLLLNCLSIIRDDYNHLIPKPILIVPPLALPQDFMFAEE